MTQAATIREQAGFTSKKAAACLHISPRYLRQCEMNGFPFVLATKAARLYGGRLDDFLPRKGKGEGKTTRS